MPPFRLTPVQRPHYNYRAPATDDDLEEAPPLEPHLELPCKDADLFEATRADYYSTECQAEARALLEDYPPEHDVAMPTVTVYCDLAAFSRYCVARGLEPLEVALSGFARVMLTWLEDYDAPNLLTALAYPTEHILYPALTQFSERIRLTRQCQGCQVNVGIFGIVLVVDSTTPVVTTPIIHLIRMELPLSAVIHMISRMRRPSPSSPPEMPRILRLSTSAISREQLLADAAALNQQGHALGSPYRQSLAAEPPRYIFTFKSSSRACTPAFLEDFNAHLYSPCPQDLAPTWISEFTTLAEAVNAELDGIYCLRREPWPGLTYSNPPEWALCRARIASLQRLEEFIGWLVHCSDLRYNTVEHTQLLTVLMERIRAPKHRGVTALLAAPEPARRLRRLWP